MFIELTKMQYESEIEDGIEPVKLFIRPEDISAMAFDGQETTVTHKGYSSRVKETPQEIIKLMREHV